MTLNWNEVLDAASGDVRRLSYVTRFSSIPVTIPENVSDHSFYVTLYSVLIHNHLDEDNVWHKSLLAPIMLHAVTHDISESVTGDLVRTFKYSSPEFKNAVNMAEQNMLSCFPLKISELYNMWEHAAGDRKRYVKAVVKAADFMSLHQYMVREVARGNQEIGPFFERMISDLRQEGYNIKSDPDSKIASLSGLYMMMSNTTSFGRRTA